MSNTLTTTTIMADGPAVPAPAGRSPIAASTPVDGFGPRYRLTRRGRMLVVGLGVSMLALCGVAHAAGSFASGDRSQQSEVIVVQPGQSLWTIASGVTGGTDVDAMITEIEGLNHLDDAAVQSGERLRVPTAG